MAWFRFLIFFSLWASAFSNVVLAVMYLTGAIYDLEFMGMADAVYAEYPSMRALDVAFAIAAVGIAVFSVYTRFRLAGFKKNGPQTLAVLYILSCAVSVLYAFVSSAMIGELSASDLSSLSVNVLVTAILVAANRIYFDKRKHLFVN